MNGMVHVVCMCDTPSASWESIAPVALSLSRSAHINMILISCCLLHVRMAKVTRLEALVQGPYLRLSHRGRRTQCRPEHLGHLRLHVLCEGTPPY